MLRSRSRPEPDFSAVTGPGLCFFLLFKILVQMEKNLEPKVGAIGIEKGGTCLPVYLYPVVIDNVGMVDGLENAQLIRHTPVFKYNNF